MKNLIVLSVIFLTSFCDSQGDKKNSTVVSTNNDDSSSKYALLVGIDKYEMISDLHGCVNDVNLMQDLLIRKFGFLKNNIKVLTNEQATRAGIIDAFKNHLIANIKEGDVVVFHYSGHGAQIRNLAAEGNSEMDNREEILVTHDFVNDRNAPFNGIVDDEINGLLVKLSQVTENVTFILDACHSAGASKALDLIRKVDVEPREIRQEDMEDFAIGTRNLRSTDASYAFIAGCKANQYSYEMSPAPNGDTHGALTYFFVDELSKSGASVSYEDIIGNVRTHIKKRYTEQYPELFGTEINKEVFGVRDLTPVSHANITAINGNTVTLNIGKTVGTTEGSEFLVFAPNTDLREKNKNSIGRIRISQVNAYDSKATIIGDHSISKINSKVIEVKHNYGDLVLSAYFEGDWSGISALKESVSNLSFVSPTNTKMDADLLFKKNNNGFEIYLGYDLEQPKKTYSDNVSAEDLKEYVEEWASWFAGILIRNPQSTLEIEAVIEPGIQGKIPKGLTDLITNNDHVFQAGDTFKLTITNKSDRPVFIHILDIVDTPGTESLCLSDFVNGTDQLPAGQSETFNVETFLEDGVDRSKEVLKIIATLNGEVNLNYLTLGCYNDNTKNIRPPKKGQFDTNSWTTVDKIIEVKR